MRYSIQAYKELSEKINGLTYKDRFMVEIEKVHIDALTAIINELKAKEFTITRMVLVP